MGMTWEDRFQSFWLRTEGAKPVSPSELAMYAKAKTAWFDAFGEAEGIIKSAKVVQRWESRNGQSFLLDDTRATLCRILEYIGEVEISKSPGLRDSEPPAGVEVPRRR